MLNGWTNKLTVSASLIGAFSTIAIVQPQVAFSLTPEQVNEKAKAFTVKIDGAEKGSGVIIAKSGNQYAVLTNWHVVDSEGNYTIQTSKRTSYQGSNIQQIQRADLAIIYFSSSQSYEVAIKDNSDDLREGQTIHYAGYPTTQGRVYRFFASQSITGFLSDANIDDLSETDKFEFDRGYDIIFGGTGLNGISGGPILDNEGKLIGISGSGAADFGGASLYGIPINTAISLAQKQGLNLASGFPSPPSNQTTTPTPDKPQLTAVELFNKGEDLRKNEDYLEAINAFTQAIRLDSNYAIAYHNRGVSYHKLGNYQKAIEDYNQAIRLGLNNAISYHNRGVSYRKLGNYQKAIEDYDEAIRLDPNFAIAYHNRGVSYHKLGNYQKAIEDYKEAIRLDPNFANAYNGRGVSYNELGNYNRAIEDLNKAIRLDINFAKAYNNRGFSYDKLGNYKKAIENYKEAIRLDPNYATAKQNLESILRRR